MMKRSVCRLSMRRKLLGARHLAAKRLQTIFVRFSNILETTEWFTENLIKLKIPLIAGFMFLMMTGDLLMWIYITIKIGTSAVTVPDHLSVPIFPRFPPIATPFVFCGSVDRISIMSLFLIFLSASQYGLVHLPHA